MNKEEWQKLSNIEKNQHRTNFYLRALLEHHQVVINSSAEDWLDDTDLMLRFHWSKRKIERLRADRSLPYRKVKRKCYYRQQDIDQLFKEGVDSPGKPSMLED